MWMAIHWYCAHQAYPPNSGLPNNKLQCQLFLREHFLVSMTILLFCAHPAFRSNSGCPHNKFQCQLCLEVEFLHLNFVLLFNVSWLIICADGKVQYPQVQMWCSKVQALWLLHHLVLCFMLCKFLAVKFKKKKTNPSMLGKSWMI